MWVLSLNLLMLDIMSLLLEVQILVGCDTEDFLCIRICLYISLYNFM